VTSDGLRLLVSLFPVKTCLWHRAWEIKFGSLQLTKRFAETSLYRLLGLANPNIARQRTILGDGPRRSSALIRAVPQYGSELNSTENLER
jgi:hypothetical protein